MNASVGRTDKAQVPGKKGGISLTGKTHAPGKKGSIGLTRKTHAIGKSAFGSELGFWDVATWEKKRSINPWPDTTSVKVYVESGDGK